MSEIAERISAALGKTVRYVNVSPEEYKEALVARGLPALFVNALETLFAERRKRQESRVDLRSHEAFGIQPTTFAEFARRNAAAFRGES